MPDVIASISDIWLKQVEESFKPKEDQFGRDAKRAWRFYGENHEFLYMDMGEDSGLEAGVKRPFYKATINKTAEFVKLMLPYLHHKAPNRIVEPRRPVLPPEIYGLKRGIQPPKTPEDHADTARSSVIQWLLNYTPSEFNLRTEGRQTVTEALVKGRGLLWCELVNTPRGYLVGSFYDTVDNLFVDPDAKRLKDCAWVCRRRFKSVWKVADEFGIPVKLLRANAESHRGRVANSAHIDAEERRRAGEDKDTICYYEFYSRAGLGQNFGSSMEHEPEMAAAMGKLGRNVYVAIAPGMKHPLNLVPENMNKAPNKQEYIQEQLRWPIPFHVDYCSPWPFSELDFYYQDNSAWPMSPLSAAMPLQHFLDFAYSWLMSRIRQTGRDITVVSGAVQEDLKQAILYGRDLEVVFMKHAPPGTDIRNIVQQLQFNPVNADIWKILAGVENQFERATGMTELMYGQAGDRQMRSATEVNVRQQNVSVRPDDMAECTEAFMSDVARKEAMALRLFTSPQTIAALADEPFDEPTEENPFPKPGPITQVWAGLCMTDDPWRASADLNYTIEAGSGRKPNKARQIEDINAAAQVVLGPFLDHFRQTGDPLPYNGFMQVWARRHEEDPSHLLLPVPGQDDEEEKEPSPEERQQAMAEQQQQMEMQMEAQKKEMELQAAQQKQQMDMEAAQQKQEMEMQRRELELQAKAAELELKQVEFQLEQARKEAEHEQKLDHAEEEHEQKLIHGEEDQELDLENTAEMAKAKAAAARTMAAAVPARGNGDSR